jgi:translocator protein
VNKGSANTRGGWVGLAGWLALCFAAGGAGTVATSGVQTFYAQLVKPVWAPPPWLFAPAWTLLYILMAVAAWLVWRERDLDEVRALSRRQGLVLFVVQLVLNALWTWLFFRWRLGGPALVELVLMWIMVAAVARLFSRVRPVSAWLLVPYLCWLVYAGALNWAVWRANPGVF